MASAAASDKATTPRTIKEIFLEVSLHMAENRAATAVKEAANLRLSKEESDAALRANESDSARRIRMTVLGHTGREGTTPRTSA